MASRCHGDSSYMTDYLAWARTLGLIYFGMLCGWALALAL